MCQALHWRLLLSQQSIKNVKNRGSAHMSYLTLVWSGANTPPALSSTNRLQTLTVLFVDQPCLPAHPLPPHMHAPRTGTVLVIDSVCCWFFQPVTEELLPPEKMVVPPTGEAIDFRAELKRLLNSIMANYGQFMEMLVRYLRFQHGVTF